MTSSPLRPLTAPEDTHSLSPEFKKVLSFSMSLVAILGFFTLTCLHLLLWQWIGSTQGQSLNQILQHWDAGWYLRIAQQGYDATSAAFLPLFPLILKVLGGGVLNHSIWLGAIFSCLCFVLAISTFTQLYRTEGARGWATVLLILSPASYVFHTVHTESLFLLVSLWAFAATYRHHLWLAALGAGVASLLRHQGVFLAVAVASSFFLAPHQSFRQRCLAFAKVGLISGSIWSLSGLLHYTQGRGFFPAFAAHEQGWFVADGWRTYIKTFFFANPIQNFRVGSILHHLFYLACLGASLILLYRKSWLAGIYCLLSLLICPAQGEFVDAFRFGAVLFPVCLFYAEKIQGLAPLSKILGFIGLLALNLVVAWQYGIHRWAY